MDDLITLILVLFVIAVLLTAVVFPIVAFVLSLSARKTISRLEARINRLEATLAPPSVQPQQQPIAEPPPQPKRAETPEPAEPEPPPLPLTPAPRTLSAAQIESIIGRRWVGWAAVSLILFATAFFMKYAFENRWIGEVGRVAIGITFGILMCIAGFRYYQRRWRIFSQILTAGG